MLDFLKEVRRIGFDLDQTLYPNSPEIQKRVRNEIANRIVLKNPRLSIKEARELFEKRYTELQSGTKVLKEVGYENPERTMDDCLAQADILDLIQRNTTLADILERLTKKYGLFLITSSPEELANKKLEKIGISQHIFDYRLFSTTPNVGSKNAGEAFQYLINLTKIKPSEHLYIGDRLKSDILPAKRMGMHTGVVWNHLPEADFSIPHINDLEKILL